MGFGVYGYGVQGLYVLIFLLVLLCFTVVDRLTREAGIRLGHHLVDLAALLNPKMFRGLGVKLNPKP